MSDSYTQFSEMIEELTEKEEKWLEEILHFDPETDNTDELLERLPQLPYSFDFDNYPGFEYELKRKDKNLWLYSEETYCEENLCNVIYAFIKKFRPESIFTLSGGYTCSQLRLKEFGGVWLVISADGVKGGNTWDAAEEQVAKIWDLRKRIAARSEPSIRRMPRKTKSQSKKG